jgi:type II restriction enzyme
MMRAIAEDRLPHLLLLSYCYPSASVQDLVLIPKFCIPPSSIEARKPLSPTARRAGWVGCNIVLGMVPPEGRIEVISSRNILPRSAVREKFRRVQPLKEISSKKRGWTLDVLTVLRSLGKRDFTLEDAYSFEDRLSGMHPENRHVRPKIRQQLQILRDMGYLRFLGRGHYRWVRT